MLTILIFSLVLAHNNPSIKEPRGYRCQVESASEIPGSKRSLNVSVQDPWISATKGKLSRSQKAITLECFRFRSSVQVNLLYLDKMDGDWTNQTVEKCTLRSLRVATSAGRNSPIGHTCVLLTHHRRKFQRKLIHREKVFLARTSNHVTRAKLPKVKAFAEGSTVLRAHQENQTLEERIPSTNGKDMPNRQKLSIIGKAFIIFIVLAFAIFCSMFVVFGIPCLVRWLGVGSDRGTADPQLHSDPTSHCDLGSSHLTSSYPVTCLSPSSNNCLAARPETQEALRILHTEQIT